METTVYHAMMEKFKVMLPQKMAENGVEVEVETCSPQEQADYFFDVYRKIKESSDGHSYK